MSENKEQQAAAARRAEWVAALENERRAYEVHGKADRVKAVDEQLRIFKGEGKPKVTRGRSQSE